MMDLILLFFLCSLHHLQGHLDLIYIGCFVEGPNRLLETFRAVSPLTNEECVQECWRNGHIYAGTENSRECWCGDSNPPANLAVTEEECYMSCNGNLSQICGGPWRLSVYDSDLQILSSTVHVIEPFTSDLVSDSANISTDTTSVVSEKSDMVTDTSTIVTITTQPLRSDRYIPCCCTSHSINITNEEFNNKLQELKKKLKVQRKDTSQYKAKKVCATDKRSSATYTGIILGASILISLSALIVVSDIAFLFCKPNKSK